MNSPNEICITSSIIINQNAYVSQWRPYMVLLMNEQSHLKILLRNVSLIFVQWWCTCIVHSIRFILISMFDVQNNRAIICIQMWYDSTYLSTHWILVTVFFTLLVLIVIVAMVIIIVVAGDVTLLWITHWLLLKNEHKNTRTTYAMPSCLLCMSVLSL